MFYQKVARPVLFRLGGGDAEAAHDTTVRWLGRVAAIPGLPPLLRRAYLVEAPRVVFGLRFANPVGLAAGLDKDARALRSWPALGLGFVEVGTVTPGRQEGSPRPRLFRLAASEAVINRMGFANIGAPALARRLRTVGHPGVPLGISLGKSAGTPLPDAADDYVASLRLLYDLGDYFAVNVSSPNTPGLRSLQRREHLAGILGRLWSESATLARGGDPKPILVKISPDLTDSEIAEVVDECLAHGVAGVVATNTTVSRDGVAAADQATAAAQAGGLSGRPLARRARAVVALVHRETGGRLPVVGVGGILSPDDALRLFDAGASLVQVCTGLIYRGPALVKSINRAHTGGRFQGADGSDEPRQAGPQTGAGSRPAGEPR